MYRSLISYSRTRRFLYAGRRHAFSKTARLDISRQYSVNYELKYAERIRQVATEKGLSVGQLKEQAKLSRQEANLQLPEPGLAAREQPERTSAYRPIVANPHVTSRKDNSPVKPLSSILNTTRVLSTPHTLEQVSQLWNGYHMSRSGGTGVGYLCASIPLHIYNKMSAVAEKYPSFVVPILRPRDATAPPAKGGNDSAYEFYFLQWDFHDAPAVPSADDGHFVKPPSSESPNPKTSTVLFTPLEEYKLRGTFATPYLALTNYTDLASTHGLVLLRGEITPRNGASGKYMLNQEDAQQLSMAIQRFYLWGDGQSDGETLLRTFHEKPEEFQWQDLLKVADWEI